MIVNTPGVGVYVYPASEDKKTETKQNNVGILRDAIVLFSNSDSKTGRGGLGKTAQANIEAAKKR